MLFPDALNCLGFAPVAKNLFHVLNWSSMLAADVLGCKDGSFFCAWAVFGLDTESLEPAAFEATMDSLAIDFGGFGNGNCFWVVLNRKPSAGLQQVGLTFEDVESEAQLLDQISGGFSGMDGNLKPLQVSNEFSSSVARQLVELRTLTVIQAQQNTAASSRVLAYLDRKESVQQDTDVEIQESIEAYDGSSEHRSVNEILGA